MKNPSLVLGMAVVLSSCSNAGTCPSGMWDCMGICVDLVSDRANCGGCGVTCSVGQVCSEGACTLECTEGRTPCSGVCRDLSSDQYNCGVCGTACATGFVCVDGSCAPDCPEGYTSCSGVCRNLGNDPANCGGCASPCDAGWVCSLGECTFACPSPYVDCSGSCVDLGVDHLNCGSCGAPCGTGQVCVGGACANSCLEGLTMCSGTCYDLERDPENCGACARRCGDREACIDATCVLACVEGFTNCSGACRDLDRDRANCGSCGTTCLAGEVCDMGVCDLVCVAPLTECTGYCTNTDLDPRNCGACGTRCDETNASAYCEGGGCALICDAGYDDCDTDVRTGCETELLRDSDNCGTCGHVCGTDEICISGLCEPFVGIVGTARTVGGTWIPVNYELCGSGAPGSCTATAAKTACTAIGMRVISHASNGTSEVLSLGATSSCYWDVSYFTVVGGLPPGSCLVGISNLEWTSCCGTSSWHGNTIAFGAPGVIFGYVNAGDSGYVSTYPNVSGTTWGCVGESTAASNRTGCSLQYVACSP